MANLESSVPSSQEVLHLQQLLIQKEKEIGNLNLMFDKQEAKITNVTADNTQLREQLTMNNDQNSLKQAISGLNEQLSKQQNLNRLQAGQILDFEQKLWQANKQRDEAENNLDNQRSSQSAPNPGESEPNFNQDLRVKHIQIRDLNEKIDAYQGKASVINGFSRSELTGLNDELTQTLFAVQVAMKNTVKK
jgi:hypothetical protein